MLMGSSFVLLEIKEEFPQNWGNVFAKVKAKEGTLRSD